jgi:predicted metal-dependent hydrolase
MTMEENAALAEWLRLLNEGQYFEAHEVLEAPWLRAAAPQRAFLKGLIHVAVALLHYQRGNAHGARVKARSARRYLEPFAPAYAGIAVDDLLRQLAEQVSPLEALPPGASFPRPPRAALRVLRVPATGSAGET